MGQNKNKNFYFNFVDGPNEKKMKNVVISNVYDTLSACSIRTAKRLNSRRLVCNMSTTNLIIFLVLMIWC